ncbi:putative flippase GtrA [Krasilnikovia cinnamomea]|uniref:Putative flippase GtrA n=1 Tax=Krasilnikovia cinnamomea TaxID=349313 RepID=A0A4V2G6S0_9ACTN|nr:GtrA family protein [Krasilnikovia cinnamomea]RZU49766.1 putative flippase GtrA [Krasilnikovia cinnamomea]
MRRAEFGRLLRYGCSGAASAATHFGTALVLVEGPGMPPVPASTVGFGASIVVSYVLQRNWVFRARTRHAVGGARFLAVTAVALACNTAVVWAGTALLGAPYRLVQAVALVLIPLVNYTINSRWTFRDRRRAGLPRPPAQGTSSAESSGASSRL